MEEKNNIPEEVIENKEDYKSYIYREDKDTRSTKRKFRQRDLEGNYGIWISR